jgi:hypothetical protein
MTVPNRTTSTAAVLAHVFGVISVFLGVICLFSLGFLFAIGGVFAVLFVPIAFVGFWPILIATVCAIIARKEGDRQVAWVIPGIAAVYGTIVLTVVGNILMVFLTVGAHL